MTGIRPLILAATLAVLVFSYATNFSAPLFYMDDYQLLTLPQLQQPFSWPLIKTVFTPGFHVDFYPIRELSYWIDIHFFSTETFVLRAHNALLFLGTGIGIYFILCFLGLGTNYALGATSLWLINPFHYEMVWWISARKDLLALLFFTWSTVFWLVFDKTKKKSWGLLSLFLFLISLLSKATFVLVPFVLLAQLIRSKKPKAQLGFVFSSLLFAVFWGSLQKWQYTEVSDMRFFYPLSYRISASISALGRMVLGTLDPWVNAVDIYNWGEWLSFNFKFFKWGVLFLSLSLGLSRYSFPRKKLLLFVLFFWATYLPTSGLLFPHMSFYSVRYFEAPLLVIYIGATYLIHTYQDYFNFKVFAFFVAGLFAYFSTALLYESSNWENSLTTIKKAMKITPGNLALTGFYWREINELAKNENPPKELTALSEKVGTGLMEKCMPFVKSGYGPNSSLCHVVFGSGIYPVDPKTRKPPFSVAENILNLQANHLAIAHRTSVELEKKNQWAKRVVDLNELNPPPTDHPILNSEAARLLWLKALRIVEPGSKKADELQREWEVRCLLRSKMVP